MSPRRLALALLCALAAAPALAAERITEFVSDLVLAPSGELTVTEFITVTAEGQQIRHGIYRDLPTSAPDASGTRHPVALTVLGAMLDGQAVPYRIERIPDGERLRIGRPDALLPPGEHRFTLRYATDGQVSFLAEIDELAWNVTGNGWPFPIERARAVLHLPEGALVRRVAVQTGPRGATGADARALRLDARSLGFETTRPLGPQEGLTIAAGFAKGLIAPSAPMVPTAGLAAALGAAPSPRYDLAALLADPRNPVPAAGTLLLLGYFGLAWALVGRDPPRGTIIPRFAPPEALSPATVRFLDRLGYDRTAYAAALVDLAVKGFLRITEQSRVYTLRRTDKPLDAPDLLPPERRMATELFDGGTEVTLSQADRVTITGSMKALGSALEAACQPAYLRDHSLWFVGGVAIYAATLLATVGHSGDPNLAGGAMLTLLILSLLVGVLGVLFAGVAFSRSNRSRLFLRLIALAYIIGGGFAAYRLSDTPVAQSVLPALSLAGALAVPLGALACTIFFRLLKAPTRLGGTLRDEIAGFRMFLATAEQDRLDMLNPPEVTPEIFERFLPYAIALDCETAWAAKFQNQLASATQAIEGVSMHEDHRSDAGYAPAWFSGSSFDATAPAEFGEMIGVQLETATISASTGSGSGGFSGGGGSSGGGGGGGGGGGW